MGLGPSQGVDMDTLFCYLKSCTKCGGDVIYEVESQEMV